MSAALNRLLGYFSAFVHVGVSYYSASAVELRLVEAQGGEFLSVHFVFKRAGFYPSGARGAGFLSQFLNLVFF